MLGKVTSFIWYILSLRQTAQLRNPTGSFLFLSPSIILGWRNAVGFQNSAKFKIYELFISVHKLTNFFLILSFCNALSKEASRTQWVGTHNKYTISLCSASQVIAGDSFTQGFTASLLGSPHSQSLIQVSSPSTTHL